MNLPVWLLIIIFSFVRTFYLAMAEAFLVWGFAALFLPTNINYVTAFVICGLITFIISIFRVRRWFKD